MPFTFSHPVAVLPFKKINFIKFSITGLYFGSIAPDLEYFFRMRLESTLSETFAGFFIFNLPVAIFSALIFHLLIRDVVIINLPSPLDKNYSRAVRFNFVRYLHYHWFIFLLSCVIGILSHLFLDYIFDNQAAVRDIISFASPKNLFALISVRTMRIAEHLFSLFAFIFLIYYFYKNKEYKTKDYQPIPSKNKWWFWLRIIFLTTAITIIRIETSVYIFRAGAVITVIISGIMISLFVISLYERFIKKTV